MSARALTRIEDFQPSTFAERGVAVPFTTPVLVGARARPAAGGGVELLIPNPSGGRGIYIVPWNGLSDLCRPTLHDNLLSQQVAALPVITPRNIARVARDIAAGGSAGREARAAAREARQAERDTTLLVNFFLLMLLLEQVEMAGPPLPQGAERAEVELRARAAMAHIAPQVGCAASAIADHLETLAELYVPVGIGSSVFDSRMTRLLAALAGLRDETVAWADSSDGEAADAARMIGAAATLTVACAGRTMTDARNATTDLPGLLRRFVADAQEVGEEIARTEWLLDGWEQICLLWRDAASRAEKAGILLELALMVPALPKQLLDWVKLPTGDVPQFRRSVRLNEDWRTGAIVNWLIERNERLLSLAM